MNPQDPDYIVEISSLPAEDSPDPGAVHEAHITASRAAGRPFISVFLECCSAYQRGYRTRAATAYQGRCPRCLRSVCVKIGPEGSSDRFFTAE